jgi:hypothetical protein
MRFATRAIVLAVALAPAACASAAREPIPVYGSAPIPATFRLVETPAVKPPANDISEADRRAWFDANRPQSYYVPSQEEPVAEESSCYGDCHGHGWGLGLPLSIGLGYYGGGCHGGGFGVGVNVLGIGVGVGFGGW